MYLGGNIKTFLIEFENTTDCRDNECYKVKARNEVEALEKAREHCRSNFNVGQSVCARGGTKAERELASHFRKYCVGTIE